MAFEPFPVECVDAFNDPGIYYVNENGKLRSPPGMGHTSRTSQQDAYEFGLPKVSCFILGENYDGSTLYTPRSLFDQTINFVARNLWRVDSLIGFPDIVGKQLFEAAKEQLVFQNQHLRSKSLRLFNEAYGSQVLSALNLSGSHVILAEYLDDVMMFCGLSELELGGCGLGEEHEMWLHIGNMPCLKKLGLSNNGMTDRVVQKLTTPLRLMKRGPKGLNFLDLSKNPALNNCIIRYLKVFQELQALDLSGCYFLKNGMNQLQEEMKLRPITDMEDPEASVFHHSVETTGWAGMVIKAWMTETRPTTTKGLRQEGSKASKFYSSKGDKLGFLNVTPKMPCSNDSLCIRLVRDRDECSRPKSASGECTSKETTDGVLHMEKRKNIAQECEDESSRSVKRLRVTEEADGCESIKTPRTAMTLTVKGKRKRIKCVETRKDDDDDDDLLNDYLKFRASHENSNDGDKSKLISALTSSPW